MKELVSKGCLGVVLMIGVGVAGCIHRREKGVSAVSYPYTAVSARRDAIRSGLSKIDRNMPAAEVRRLMGNPDEDNVTYDCIDKARAKQTGHSFVYLLERKSNTGSVVEKAERLIRVQFDGNDKVVRVERVGF